MSLLAACVLGHSLGSFTDSVFGQFTGQKQPDGRLDFARFITKPPGDQLTNGSKSFIFHWLFNFKVKMPYAYVNIIQQPIKISKSDWCVSILFKL